MKPKIVLGVMILLLASLVWRVNAFWSQHWKGDQGHYTVLAMKLGTVGLNGYNLREVFLGPREVDVDGQPVQIMTVRRNTPGSEGHMIRSLKFVGQDYYDEPLHMRAPLFSYMLTWSHALFHPGAIYEVFSGANSAWVIQKKPWSVFKAQFWASVVPVFFNLCVILLTFLMASRFFNYRVGFMAALILATNPVALFVSYRLLSEDVTTFFVMLSFFLLWIYLPRRNWVGLFFAGAFGGLALATRQTAGMLVHMAWIYLVICRGRSQWNARGWIGSLFHPVMIVFGLGVFSASAFWFLKVISVYGTPLHIPQKAMEVSLQSDVTGWFKTLGYKLPPVFFFALEPVRLCPAFAALFLTIGSFNKRAQVLWRAGGPPAQQKDPVVFLWLWVIAFYLWSCQPWRLLVTAALQESRYLYPAYPAMAILSAWALDRVRAKLMDRGLRALWIDAALALFFLANGIYTLAKFAPYAYSNLMMI